MEIKNLKELQLKEYAITQPEVETLLNYLGQRPWVEVNDLMVILLRKINGQGGEQPKLESTAAP